jgi:peptide chain release factor subunit 3
MKDRISSDVCSWYDGPSLLELLDNIPVPRKYDGALMFPIADRFKDMGTIVLGKLESGKIRKGQTVMIMPNKKIAEVSAIFMEDSEIPMAKCGDNVRLRLKNVEEEDVSSGFVLCSPRHPVHTVTAFEAQLRIVEYKSIMCAGYSAVMHAHTLSEEVVLSVSHAVNFNIERNSCTKLTRRLVKNQSTHPNF